MTIDCYGKNKKFWDFYIPGLGLITVEASSLKEAICESGFCPDQISYIA